MPTVTYGGLNTALWIQYPTTSWVQVSQIVSIDGPESEMGERDITHLGSAAVEAAPTICDNGEISGSMIYTPSDPGVVSFQSLVQTAASSTITHVVNGSIPTKIVLPTTTKVFTFNAFPKRLAFTGVEPTGGWNGDWSMRISGAVTYPTT